MNSLEELYAVFETIQAVIFDLDGLLIRSEEAWIQSETELLRNYGLGLSTKKIREITEEYLPGRSQDEAAKFYKEKFNLPDSIEKIREKRIRIVKNYYKKAPLTKGSLPLLKVVRESGLKTGLASSAPMELIKIVMKTYGLQDFFEAIISDDHIERGKPEPDIFLKAAKKIGVTPSQCLVFEDTGHGLQAAKGAGMVAVLVPNPHLPSPPVKTQVKADFVLDSLADINLDKLERTLN